MKAHPTFSVVLVKINKKVIWSTLHVMSVSSHVKPVVTFQREHCQGPSGPVRLQHDPAPKASAGPDPRSGCAPASCYCTSLASSAVGGMRGRRSRHIPPAGRHSGRRGGGVRKSQFPKKKSIRTASEVSWEEFVTLQLENYSESRRHDSTDLKWTRGRWRMPLFVLPPPGRIDSPLDIPEPNAVSNVAEKASGGIFLCKTYTQNQLHSPHCPFLIIFFIVRTALWRTQNDLSINK